MMMNSKRIFTWIAVIAAASVLVYGAGRLYFSLTDGFSVSNITIDLPEKREWEIRPFTPEEAQIANEALSQDYHYLAKGHQAYVFESRDGKYVIKFIKFQRITPKPWYKYLPLFGSWNEWRQEKIKHKAAILDAFFDSWKISFEDLKEEAAVVMVHLNRTKNLNKTITFVDKMGFSHTLNMDDMVFQIQKKTIPFDDVISEQMASGNVAAAKQLLDRLLNLYVGECRRGYFERDYWIMRNTGVTPDNVPMHIDTGRFVYDEKLKDPQVCYEQILWKSVRLRPWLQKHYPVLSVYYEGKLEELSKQK